MNFLLQIFEQIVDQFGMDGEEQRSRRPNERRRQEDGETWDALGDWEDDGRKHSSRGERRDRRDMSPFGEWD